MLESRERSHSVAFYVQIILNITLKLVGLDIRSILFYFCQIYAGNCVHLCVMTYSLSSTMTCISFCCMRPYCQNYTEAVFAVCKLALKTL